MMCGAEPLQAVSSECARLALEDRYQRDEPNRNESSRSGTSLQSRERLDLIGCISSTCKRKKRPILDGNGETRASLHEFWSTAQAPGTR
jgi:hypothetical protein